MKKITFSLVFLFVCLHADNSNLYKQAEELEANKQFKEAMEIYKQIAQKQKNITIKPTDKITQHQVDFIRTKIDKSDDSETNATIEQILTSSFNISAYKDNYFLPISYDMEKRVGRDQKEAKFQLSLKKPITYDILGLNETINFGYTQTSWWQIYSDSAPFRESNYRPEVFMVVPYKSLEKTALKAYKIGLIHESNGRSSTNSRSWNRAYVEAYFQHDNLFVVPRAWYRLPEDSELDDNPDIEDYLGYGDLTLLYAYKKHTFKALLRNNLKFDDENKGYTELNWSFPFFNSNNSFGYLQLSSGYGDSLIDYDKRVDRIGIGISLSR